MTVKNNPWQHVKAPDVSRNPYIHPAASPAPSVPPAPSPRTAPAVTSLDDYIKLENISCVDADNHEFERYDTLYVKKDVEKDSAGKIQTFTPYEAIHHCESFGFLPSAALMANIHVAIYHAAVERQANGTYQTKNSEMEEMLRKLQDRGDGVGGHWTNTIVDWGAQQIKHYPLDGDFPNNGGTAQVNTGRSVTKPFDRTNFANLELKAALKIPNYRQFVQNYSGLQNPEVLIEIAEYHGKNAQVWFSSSQEARAAWLGCFNDVDFSLYADSYLYNTNAARGVHEK